MYLLGTMWGMRTMYLLIEKLIEWSGDTGLTQDFRSWMLSMGDDFDGYPATQLMSSILEHDRKIRRTTQREECLLKEVQDLVARDSIALPVETQRLRELQRLLTVVRKNYWALRHNWLVLRDQLKGPTLRGLYACRSDPRWYLTDTLRRHCAEYGGCCGRECQCCENRSAYANFERTLGLGHCTFECGCCSKARGFDLTSKEIKELDAGCGRPGRHLDCSLCIRLISASFWGFEYDELCLVRKWKWWLGTRIAVIGLIVWFFCYTNWRYLLICYRM